jgi:hypothetical protein
MGANNLTTQANFARDLAVNYANEHDFDCSRVAADASCIRRCFRRTPNSNLQSRTHSNGGRSSRCELSLPRGMDRIHHMGARYPSSVLVLLLSLTLFFPLASAANVDDFSFETAIFSGPTNLNGKLKATFLESTEGVGGATLNGQALIETEFRQSNFTVPGATGQSYTGLERDQTTFNLGQLTIDSFGELMLYDLKGQTIFQSNQGEMKQGVGTLQWPQGLHPQRASPSISIDSVPAAKLQSPGATVIIGNFSISLWNAEIETEQKSYWAGDRVQPFTTGPDLSNQGIGENRQQVLHIHIQNGELRLPATPGTLTTYWSEVSLEGTGQIQFQDAFALTGVSLGRIEASNGWSLDLQQENSLVARDFEANNVLVNGAIIQDSPRTWVWWRLSLLIIVPIALAARRSPSLQVRRMESNLNNSHYEKVAGKPIKKLLTGKHASRASLYRTTSLLALGLYQEAALFLESLKHESRPDPATYHFLYAHALASQNDKINAAKHLLKCLMLAPEYAAEAEAIPVLRGLLGSIGLARSLYSESYS